MERQVIIKGTAVQLSADQSDAYFYSRPLGSQLGAIVSPQSSIIPNRSILENQLHSLEQQHILEVQRPIHWGGYCVEPISVEFWQGRPNRLHDRIRYTIQDDLSWSIDRLAP
jgi:pyridoxamine 5'-phosphate oxidase